MWRGLPIHVGREEVRMARLDQILFADAGTRLSRDLRRMQALRDWGHARLARFYSRLIQRRYGIFISPLAQVATSTRFPHPTGIVIGEGAIVHEGVTIFQNVTLGGARLGDWQAGNYPEIGTGTTIFAGAVILGRIRVGRSCTIGANSVVLDDIPDGATAVGAPARVVRQAAHRTEPVSVLLSSRGTSP